MFFPFNKRGNSNAYKAHFPARAQVVLKEFFRGFFEVLRAVSHERQGFACGVGFEVFVAHFYCDCFEEEGLADGFLGDFLG